MAGNSAYVYVLTNPSIPGLVKIGMTTKSVKERIKELSSTGVPEPFQLYYACELGGGLDPVEVERDMHELFAPYRHNKRREFFGVDPKRVKLALKYAEKPKPPPVKRVVEKQAPADVRNFYVQLYQSSRSFRRRWLSRVIRDEEAGVYGIGGFPYWEDFDQINAEEWASLILGELPDHYSRLDFMEDALLSVYADANEVALAYPSLKAKSVSLSFSQDEEHDHRGDA